MAGVFHSSMFHFFLPAICLTERHKRSGSSRFPQTKLRPVAMFRSYPSTYRESFKSREIQLENGPLTLQKRSGGQLGLATGRVRFARLRRVDLAVLKHRLAATAEDIKSSPCTMLLESRMTGLLLLALVVRNASSL